MRGSIIMAFAGLFGALGVAGAAYAAHGGDVRLIGVAAAICLVHAPALLALSIAAQRSRAFLAPATLWIVGVALFSGDLALRAIVAERLFASAAPLGGSLLILAWLSLAVVAFVPGRR